MGTAGSLLAAGGRTSLRQQTAAAWPLCVRRAATLRAAALEVHSRKGAASRQARARRPVTVARPRLAPASARRGRRSWRARPAPLRALSLNA